jgi:hypothetical protein
MNERTSEWWTDREGKGENKVVNKQTKIWWDVGR